MAAAPSTEPVAAAPPVPFTVVRRRQETHDTWTLELEPEAGAPLVVQAGQFTMLYAFGVGEVPISVSGATDGPLIHTVRAVGPVSRAICAVEPGGVVGVRGPFGGTGWPLQDAVRGDVVVVAGGIGLAPLRPAIYHIARRSGDYGRLVVLYGGRTPADLLYRDELVNWPEEGVELEVTVDAASGGWRGEVGVVPKLVTAATFDPAAATALVCGPEIMMSFTVEALLARGVRDERIFVSLERNMQCGVGHCGHCQLGPTLICRDGPVYRYDAVRSLLEMREL